MGLRDQRHTPLVGAPFGLLPDGSRFYVANASADTVGVIDTATTAVVARVNVGLYRGRGCGDP